MNSRMKMVFLTGLAGMLIGCASMNKAQVEVYPQVRADAIKVLMMPAYGMNSDETATKELETQLMVNFKPLPGSEIARQIGLYDKLRPSWEKAMESLMKDPTGGLDAGLTEVLVKAGNAAGVDALLISIVQGSSADYQNKLTMHIVCGLFDLRDHAYRWTGSYADAQGVVPVPFKAFMAKAVNGISGKLQEEKK